MIKPLFYLFLLTACMACNTDMEKVKLLTENITLPTETGKNVVVTYTDSGHVRAKIFAPLMERYATDEKAETIMPKGITIYFLDKNKKVESYLKAKYAIRYDRERRMVAKNDVVLVNAGGDTLRTEVLNWDEMGQKLYSDQYVRIATPKYSLSGKGFESNPEFTKYKFGQSSGDLEMNQ